MIHNFIEIIWEFSIKSDEIHAALKVKEEAGEVCVISVGFQVFVEEGVFDGAMVN